MEDNPTLPEQVDGWWEIMIEFHRLGVPIIRGLIGYAVDTSPNVLTLVTYSSLVATGVWLEGAFDTEYRQNSANVLTAAKDMGMKFLTNDQYQEANAFWMAAMHKLEIAERWIQIEATGVPEFSEDRHSAFTEAVEFLNFDHPIEGE